MNTEVITLSDLLRMCGTVEIDVSAYVMSPIPTQSLLHDGVQQLSLRELDIGCAGDSCAVSLPLRPDGDAWAHVHCVCRRCKTLYVLSHQRLLIVPTMFFPVDCGEGEG